MKEVRCARCSRALGFDSEEEAVVCARCLTTLEDVEETHTVVALLEREAQMSIEDAERLEALHSAITAALHNLGVRLRISPAPTFDDSAAVAAADTDQLLPSS